MASYQRLSNREGLLNKSYKFPVSKLNHYRNTLDETLLQIPEFWKWKVFKVVLDVRELNPKLLRKFD